MPTVGDLISNLEGLTLVKFVRTNGDVAPVEGALLVSIPNGEDAFVFEATPEEVAAGNTDLGGTDYTHGVWQGVNGSVGLGVIVVKCEGDAKIGPGENHVAITWDFNSVDEMADHGVHTAFVSTRAKTR